MKPTVRSAVTADLGSVAKIHVDAFPGFFLAKMGRYFLEQYYGAYLDKNETLIVAVGMDNKVIGFVAGLRDSEDFYFFLKKRWYRFIFPVAMAILNVNLLVTCLERISTIFRSNKINEGVDVPGGFHELTSIAVSPSARETGAGRILLQAYTDALKSVAGVKGVYLTTDYDENESVHRFYQSFGFDDAGEFTQGRERKMTAYTLQFNEGV